MSSANRTHIARRLMRNALVLVAVTAIFGFKAAERNADAAPAEVAAR